MSQINFGETASSILSAATIARRSAWRVPKVQRLAIVPADGADAAAGSIPRPAIRIVRRTPIALLRGAATVLPRPLLVRLMAAMLRSLERAHPRLLENLARLEPAVIHIVPHDLPYRFVLRVGSTRIALDIAERDAPNPDASVAASVATLVDLLEGRIDSDTLFFRRDLTISGDTSVLVGLRNVLDRDEWALADELARPFGPLAPAARAVARVLDRVVDGLGARIGAIHATWHPRAESGPDAAAELARCRSEIEALTARLGRLEARQHRRGEPAS